MSIKFNPDRMRVASLRKKTAAPFGSGSPSASFGGGLSNAPSHGIIPGQGSGGRTQYNPVYDDLSEGTIIEQFMPVDPRRLHRIWRRIHLQDPVAGPALDLYTELPWSDFQLTGIEDKDVLHLYTDALNAINITALLPEISTEFLKMGKVIGHLEMDDSKGYYKRLIIHDPDWIKVDPCPIPGFPPKLDIIPTPQMRKWAVSTDDRDVASHNEARELVELIKGGREIPLPPEQSFYIPRKTAPYDSIGASAYTRILLFVAYEKALINGTIAAAKRRLSRIRHVTAGLDDTWEPSPQELDGISGLFMQADEDTVGAIVVTRTGVSVNEVGGGTPADIVKISDEWQFLQSGKLNSMGVSEAFLRGESSYNCITGDSLIQTADHGLISIANLADEKISTLKSITKTVNSRFGAAPTRLWHYNGDAPVTKVVTQSGNSITGTPRHPLLVCRDGELLWVHMRDLSVGDELCLPTNSLLRESVLPLNLEDIGPLPKGWKYKTYTKPTEMSPELAFILACSVAEGSYKPQHKNSKTYGIQFANSNPALLDRYEQLVSEVFGASCFRNKVVEAGQEMLICGVSCSANKDSYDSVFSSKLIKHWFLQLGVLPEKSRKKQVPWSILQADEKSQLAFLAAYLECDGSFRQDSDRISFHSSSKILLSQIQAMLNAHGIMCDLKPTCVAVGHTDSLFLYSKLEPFMVSKRPSGKLGTKARKLFGIKHDWLRKEISLRKIKSDRRGTFFITDDGSEVCVRSWTTNNPLYTNEQRLLYDQYTSGKYVSFLEKLAQISKKLHTQVLDLLSLRYRYSPIVRIESAGIQPVYDLTMQDSTNRSFVANGIISSNTMEQLMSVFLEKVRAHRNFMTHYLLVDKILKPLAERHRFVKRSSAELNHRVRIARDITHEGLLLPDFNWEKSLRPVADRDYLEILEFMSSKGIPVTMRTWAASAGFNLDSEIQQFDDDIEIRKQLSAHTKKIQEVAPETMAQPGAGGGLGGGLGGGDMGPSMNLDTGGGGAMPGAGGGPPPDLGMDLDSTGGGGLGGAPGGDMGGLGGPGSAGGGAGGAGQNPNITLPTLGASFRGAGLARKDRESMDTLLSLPHWSRKDFMGITKEQTELAARRLLDDLGNSTSKAFGRQKLAKILNTGNARKDQVLQYILARAGILHGVSLSRDVASDITDRLCDLLKNGTALAAELRYVYAYSLYRPEISEEVKNSHIPTNLARVSIPGERDGNRLLTGYVDDGNVTKGAK